MIVTVMQMVVRFNFCKVNLANFNSYKLTRLILNDTSRCFYCFPTEKWATDMERKFTEVQIYPTAI